MAYTTIDNPELYFQIKLYAGTGSAQSVTFDGSEDMQPDWVWGKGRDVTNLHALFDSVRGTGKALYTDRNNAEENQAQGVTAFNSDGFSMGTLGDLNASSKNFVAWNWKAGGSASSNSDGGITSSVSANTTAGFSIVSYTGTGSAATVGHGLGVKPKVMIVKNRDATENWMTYHEEIDATAPEDYYILINLTNARVDESTVWNDTAPAASVFTVGTHDASNKSSDKYIAYCFAEKKGYSKFGSYTGNGSSSDGTFVHTGFRPAWVLIKRKNASGHDWVLIDSKRLGYNADNNTLLPNSTAVEATDNRIDILSNGFKNYNANGSENESGGEYIYLAFAENPFVNSSGIPCNAR